MRYRTVHFARRAIAVVCLFCMLAVCAAGCSKKTGSSSSQSSQGSVQSSQGSLQSDNASSGSLTSRPSAQEQQQVAAQEHMPQASGTVVYGNNTVEIDASNTAQGYVMVRYTGTNQKVKMQLTREGGTTYTYDLSIDEQYQTFPLSDGDGAYTLNVFENIESTKYSQLFGVTFDVTMADSLLPFLGPNQYVDYTPDCDAALKSYELCSGATTDIDKISLIYNFVISNITYDYEEAKTVQSGYLPDVDEVLETKTGICFDYAALMAAMMRVQGIPTRLAVGYAGSTYHAWICVYTEETGWINGLIQFDGKEWKLMDPTFASSGNQSSSIMEFIGDGTNYNEMYSY